MVHAHPALRSPDGRPLIFAHRGGSALAPENTLAAFDRGVAAGADGLELDVHLSRDEVAVVHHDRTLDRTTDASGPIARLTAHELAQVDAGFRFGPPQGHPFRGRGVGVPRLRDVLARYPGVPLIVELKVDRVEMAAAAIGDVRAAGALDRVCFGSYGLRVLAAARLAEPRVPTGAAREEVRWALYRSWLGLRVRNPPFQVFHVPEHSGLRRIVSRRFVRLAHAAGLPVQVWTVNAPDHMRRLLDWGVDAIITDRPDVGVQVVRERL